MTKRKEPQLGNVVRDVTTGVTGIATQYSEMLSGTVQMAVQPLLPEKTKCAGPADPAFPALNVDVGLLDFVSDGIADRVQPATADHIDLGNVVEDKVTRLVGTAITRTTFINGCVYYHVLPQQTAKQREEGKEPESSFVAVQRLRVHNEGLAAEMAENLAAPPATRPGGPSTRAPRAS